MLERNIPRAILGVRLGILNDLSNLLNVPIEQIIISNKR